MILEGLCTTRNADGATNVAPMGPIVDRELTSFHFRPFQTSTTYSNLAATRCGVFHVTDDVEMIARAALGELKELPPFHVAECIDGSVIVNACRWYEFEVVSIDDSQMRTEIATRVVNSGVIRDFWGFNRAKHAVLEAAILATRLHLVEAANIRQEMARLAVIVDKTAGEQEERAFAFVNDYIQQRLT
ncbi:DUF447 domain-containing protein [Planctomicrobium sp. SH668]|uniref:DUF447 domain-containing protein n=1 Tax=Planctomicrobium sp. SH668 TaxID=3448126 RepID=UPI003F5C4E6E